MRLPTVCLQVQISATSNRNAPIYDYVYEGDNAKEVIYDTLSTSANTFVCWTDEAGNIVSLDNSFQPTGNQIGNITYIAQGAGGTAIFFMVNNESSNDEKAGTITGGNVADYLETPLSKKLT